MTEQSNNKVSKIVGIAIVITFFAIILCVLMLPSKQNKETGKLIVDGIIEANQLDISSKIPGRLIKLHVSEGDKVDKGDLLAVISSKEIEAKKEQAQAGFIASKIQKNQSQVALSLEKEKSTAQIEQAQANVQMAYAGLNQAKAKLLALETGARPQEKEQARQLFNSAKAGYETAEKTFIRLKILADDGVIPLQKADEAEFSYKNAKANYESAKARLSLVEEGPRKEEIIAAKNQVEEINAKLKAAQTALQLAQFGKKTVLIKQDDIELAKQKQIASKGVLDEVNASLDETLLKAPNSGSISSLISREGEIISPGYAILSLIEKDEYWVEVYVDESKWANHSVGDKVNITIPAIGKTVEGKVTRVNAGEDFAVKRASNENGAFDERAVKVKIIFNEELKNLAVGMAARVTF